MPPEYLEFLDLGIAADLIYLPQPTREPDTTVREIFLEVSKVVDLHGFRDEHDKVVMESRPEQSQQFRLILGRDRISFSSYYASTVFSVSKELFAKHLKTITGICFDKLKIPFSVARIWKIDVLLPVGKIGCPDMQDSRIYLAEQVMHHNASEQIGTHFKRPAQTFGIHLLFPPVGNWQNAFDIKIESFNRDPGYVFICNTATFPAPLIMGNYEPLDKELNETEEFIKNNAADFLLQFKAST